MWGANILTRFTTGYSGSRRSREEKEWARAQRALNFADPRIYGPQPFLHGPRRYQSPPAWGRRRFLPAVGRWGGRRLQNGRGRNIFARNGENMLRREQEQREHQIRLMRGNRGFERGRRLARPLRPGRERFTPHLHHSGWRPTHPARGPRAHHGMLSRHHPGRRVTPPLYDRREGGGRRGSMASSEGSYPTHGSSYSDWSSGEDFSDVGSYTRVRPRGSPPRGGYSPVFGRTHGGRRESIGSDYRGVGPYGGVPGLPGDRPYGRGGYYHSDESFNVFPSTSRESW